MYFFLKVQSHLKSFRLLGAFVVALHSCRARRIRLNLNAPLEERSEAVSEPDDSPQQSPDEESSSDSEKTLVLGETNWEAVGNERMESEEEGVVERDQESEPSPTPSSRIPIENGDDWWWWWWYHAPFGTRSLPTRVWDTLRKICSHSPWWEDPFQPDLEWKVLWNTGVFIEGNGWQEWHQRDVRFANGVLCFQAPSHPQDPSFDLYTSPFDLRCPAFFPDTILCLSWEWATTL